MAWIILIVAGFMEVVGAVNLGASQSFTRLKPTVYMIIAMGSSLYLLSLSLAEIPIGTAYAVWTGIGAAGTALYGMLFNDDSTAWPRLLCLVLIIAGVVGMKLASSAG